LPCLRYIHNIEFNAGHWLKFLHYTERMNDYKSRTKKRTHEFIATRSTNIWHVLVPGWNAFPTPKLRTICCPEWSCALPLEIWTWHSRIVPRNTWWWLQQCAYFVMQVFKIGIQENVTVSRWWPLSLRHLVQIVEINIKMKHLKCIITHPRSHAGDFSTVQALHFHPRRM
jgi:hypothetical protein